MSAERKKIDAKQAAQNASKYFTDLTGYTEGVTIEEVEISEDGDHWLITLGYLIHDSTPMNVLSGQETIKYKVLQVDVNTGEVVSMKIRTI